jgi:hypothetical protein
MDWNFFGDHIAVLSCVGDGKRRKRCKANMARAGIDMKRVTWGKFHRKPGNNTIAENHMHFARQAYEAGAEALLVFEDDVEFFEDRLADVAACRRVMDAIKRTDEHDIFFLGQAAIGPIILTGRNVVRTSYPLGLHAYVLSRVGMKMLVDHIPQQDTSVDNWIAANMSRKYAAFPSIVWQSVCHSVPQWCGPRGYLHLQNTLEYFWLILLYGIIVFILALLVWLVLRRRWNYRPFAAPSSMERFWGSAGGPAAPQG